MDTIINFFSTLGEIINTIIGFVVSFFQDVVYVITLTGKFLGQIPSLFSWVPAEMLVILVSIFSIVVIYKILGREG